MHAKRTLSELWNSYKRSREFLSKARKTQKCYAEMMAVPLRYFRGFIVTYADERKRLTGAAVDRYISYRMACPSRCGGTIKPTTIQKELVVCSNAVKYARRREYVDIPNPFSEADIRCEQAARDVVLPREKDLELLMALPQPVRDIVEFALVTGFRKGEILGLTHERIFKRDGKCLVEFAPEDQKSRRRGTRALSQRAVEIVNEQGSTTGHVFIHKQGKVRTDFLRYNFERGLRVIGIEDFTFHDLRHTYFTRRVEEGKSILDLSEQAGHSTTRTLERVYVQSTGERAWRAVN